MPIYEYECQKCGNKFDYLVFLSREKNEVKCPKCASSDVQRMISKFATKSSEGTSEGNSCGTQSFG
jgi:putative FmdB family regulatory protein